MSRIDRFVILTDEAVLAASLSNGRSDSVGRVSVAFEMPNSLLVEHDAAALAEAVVEALRQLDQAAEPTALVIPLHWCFTARLPAPRRGNLEALAYQLEPLLPMPLEEITFALGSSIQGAVWAVAVPTAPMRTLLDALARRAVQVDGLFVDALLAAESMTGTEHDQGAVLLDGRWAKAVFHGTDVAVGTSATVPCAGSTHLVPRVAHRLGIDATGQPPDFSRWTWCSLMKDSGERPSPLERVTPGKVLTPEETVTAFAKTLSEGPPELNLRTGALARTSPSESIHRLVRHCLGWAAMLFFLLTAGLNLHDRVLQHRLGDLEAEKLTAYRRAFDVSTLPMGAALRLASERTRLEALANVESRSSKSTPIELAEPLVRFREVVAALPADLPVWLNEARLDERQLVLRGRTREHTDAERIVAAINGLPGLSAVPPRTNRLKSGGVEFSIVVEAGNER